MKNARDSRPSDSDQPFSHAEDTFIPDRSETETSRDAIYLYVWLALLITIAVIGYSLQLANSRREPQHNMPKLGIAQRTPMSQQNIASQSFIFKIT
jgi:hypothetical protein